MCSSGAQPIYRNRAGWAHDRLKRAGLSSSPRRGSWQITQAGRGASRATGLHVMGYGTRRSDLQRVGGAGDGGIDGVISLDRLGLEKVYVQAKRWQASVGRPELQAFYGALAGHKARKGVFIATSSYTAQALEFARSVEGMVLIDGKRLASLMIDHEVGVNARVLKIPKIDSDYFDEEGT